MVSSLSRANPDTHAIAITKRNVTFNTFDVVFINVFPVLPRFERALKCIGGQHLATAATQVAMEILRLLPSKNHPLVLGDTLAAPHYDTRAACSHPILGGRRCQKTS